MTWNIKANVDYKLLFTLTGHIIRYRMDEIEPPFASRSALIHLGIFQQGAGNLPQWFWSDSIMQFLQICIFMMGMRCGDCGGNLSMATSNKPSMQGWVELWFHAVSSKFRHFHLNVKAKIETCQNRRRHLSNFGEPVQTVASFPVLRWQEWHPVVVASCCWSPASSRVSVCWVQGWYSAFLGCNHSLVCLLCPLTSARHWEF